MLPIGLSIFIIHNLWVIDWLVIITIFGWVAILANISCVTFCGALKHTAEVVIENARYFFVPSALTVLLGACISYQGHVG